MKKKVVRLFMVLTVLMCIFSLDNKSVYAIDTMQNGIKVTSQTDKNSYKKGEKVTTIVTVTNMNDYDVKNVNIHISIPDEFSADETGFNIPLLKSNEIKEYKVTVIEKSSDIVVQPNDDNKTNTIDKTLDQKKESGVDTSDQLHNGMIVGLIGLTIFSGMAVVCLKKKRQIRKLFIFALISSMTLSSLSIKTVRAEDSSIIEKHIYLTQPFSYENKSYKMEIDVQYMLSNDESVTKRKITREEWITKLLSLFDYNINDREYSFSDYADAKNPKIIETAIQYSIIDIEENEAFYPTEYATREFVAYTAIMALKLTNTSKGSLQCSDSSDLLYPDEIYLAVQNEMINLIDNQFKPHRYISTDESEQVIKVITGILNSCKINSENKNYIDYQDNVKEINQDYQTVSDNIIEIKDLQGLKKGDFAVINNSNKGIAIEVEDIIKVNDTQYKIQYNEAKIENILESLHIEGIEDNTEAIFIPEEDVTVENITQLRSRAKYDSVPLNKELKLSTTIKDLSASVSLDLEEIQYRFDVDYSMWGELKINDAYFALATDLNANLTYEGEENLIERDEPEKIEKKIGTIKIPLQYGFNVGCDVYLTGTINGKLEINVTLSNTTGFQYVKNNFRTIADTKTELAKMEISASARFGVKPVAGIEWLNFDIANANANVGIGIDGKVENQLVAPYQFCIDAKAYLYASVGEELLPDITDKLSNDVDIYTANHSPFKISGHFEETGKVDECTRDKTDEKNILTVKKGETIRITDNTPLSQEETHETILISVPGTVIDYASYYPGWSASDIVNTYACGDLPIQQKFFVYTSPNFSYDITVLEGGFSIDLDTVDESIEIERRSKGAIIKYTINQGDILTIKHKGYDDSAQIGLNICGYILDGSANVTEISGDDTEETVDNYVIDSNEPDGYELGFINNNRYEFKFELPTLGYKKRELKYECTRGSVTLYIRSDTAYLADITIKRSD